MGARSEPEPEPLWETLLFVKHMLELLHPHLRLSGSTLVFSGVRPRAFFEEK